MSTFAVPVVQISAIDPIFAPTGELASNIELAQVWSYRSVVARGQFQPGDWAVYIPEGAVVPDWILAQLNLTGKLAGGSKNRVKAVTLLGQLSQGILLPVIEGCVTDADGLKFPVLLGEDLAATLGIVKYEPTVPAHMNGEVTTAHGHTINYDIENIQKFDAVLEPGEPVTITSKLHGTFTALAYDPTVTNPDLLQLHGDYGDFHGRAFAYSKGMGAQGRVFKHVDSNAHNIYHSALIANQSALIQLAELYSNQAVHVLGETFGPGVQDLHYGQTARKFRVFDIYVGQPGQGRYLDATEKFGVAARVGFDTVPVLAIQNWNPNELSHWRDAEDCIGHSHMQEGVVITPNRERAHANIGRVILKSISPAYLTRKNKHATEYQ